jgi:hypothetical protein
MEDPFYIEMVEDIETCIAELSLTVGVIKLVDTHLKETPESALSIASKSLHDTFTSVYQRLDSLQRRLYTHRMNRRE